MTTQHTICVECAGTGKQLKFTSCMGIIPFIRTLDKEKQDCASARAFIEELGWEGYIKRVWGHLTEVKKTTETCSFCLGEGVVIVPPSGQTWADNGQNWLDELHDANDWS